MTERLDSSTRKTIVVTYPKNSEEQTRTDQLFSSNREHLDKLVSVLFAHTQAPLNILHLADDGMPAQVFHHPDFTGDSNGFTDDDLPSPDIRGASVIRYENDTGKTTRADIFLSLAAIKEEAGILGFPPEVVLAGYMANEAHGCSQETYRLSQTLPEITGKSEAASTGADWGVRMLAIHNSPNPFFSSEIMQFIAKLSVPPTTVAAT